MAEKVIIGGELEPQGMSGVVTNSRYIKDSLKNKTQAAINEELYDKVGNIDAEATERSTHAVSSGGVYSDFEAMGEDIYLLNSVDAGDPVASDNPVAPNDYAAGDVFCAYQGDTPLNHSRFVNARLYYVALQDGNEGDDMSGDLFMRTLSALEAIQKSSLIKLSADAVAVNAPQILEDIQKVQAQNNMMAKSYVPAQFSGLGKKILAKNIQDVGGVDKNVMTQAFFEDEQGNALTNTVFIIQYDYTLGGNITIPAGCTLQFDGGSIDLGQYTMSGTLINDELDVTDFSKDNDITKGLQCCVNLCGNVFIPKGSYTISSTINVDSNKYIYGKEAVITTDSIINAFNLNGDNIKIDGLNFVGKTILGTDNPSYLVYARKSHSGLEICNCSFSKCTGGIYVESDYDFIKLHDNKITETVYHPSLGAGGYGIVLDNPDAGETTYFDNAEIYSNYIDAMRHCLYIQVGHNCQIHDNTFIMDAAHGSNDYDGCIMDGGVENVNIYNNTLVGGKCFYIFTNYAPNILTDKFNINISNNKIQDISTRSFGVIQFDTDGSKLNVNIVNNDMYLTEGTQSGIFIRGNGIDGFNIEGNTITINDALNLTSVHGIWINLSKSSEEASDNTKNADNINIINNNIVNKTATITVYVSGGNTNGNSCIKNIKILNNSIDGGVCAVSMQENKDVKNILIKNNICKGQSYTNIYFDNNTSGITKDIICTENILQIDPNSSSGIGVDLHISQDQNSVIKDNLETL